MVSKELNRGGVVVYIIRISYTWSC